MSSSKIKVLKLYDEFKIVTYLFVGKEQIEVTIDRIRRLADQCKGLQVIIGNNLIGIITFVLNTRLQI